ncbi:MAG TPA: NAD(P)/FAD-dependent oxidoreductase, partial [Nostoc sp.]|nr:NAD(P)/FAD-dependent oxidoreductase [Nostoc sp.]
IYFLIEFNNKLVVMIQWAWNYFTRNRGARLITGQESLTEFVISDRNNYTSAENKQPVNV